MSLTVGFINMTTDGTLAAGIARVNRYNYHSRALRLVGDKCPELSERPRVQNRPLAASGSYPVADVRQVFQRNPLAGVVRGLYDLLRDDVINVAGKAPLFAGQDFQFALGRARLLGLQLAAQLAVAIANAFDALALVECPITGHGDIGDSKVNAKESVGVNLRRFFNIASLEQVELAVAKDKIALAVQAFKQLGLALAADERHLLATSHCPDGDNALGELVGNKAVVEGEGCQRLERALGFLVLLIGIGNFSKDAHSNVSADSEGRPNIGVTELVQGELPERAFPPSHIADVVARGIGSIERLLERRVLLWSRLELDLGNKLHTDIVPSIGVLVKLGIQEGGAIPHPRYKRGVPLRLSMDDERQKLKDDIMTAKARIMEAIVDLQGKLPAGLCVACVDVDMIDVTPVGSINRRSVVGAVVIQVAG